MTSFDVSSNGAIDNYRVLIHVLCKQYSGLNVVHFNARSLNGLKLDHARHIFENSPVDIVCISETWFRSDISDSLYNFNGFKLFRNDRLGKRGVGVAVYCRSSLNVKLVSKSTDVVEFLNVEIFDNNTKILVSCVYNPNRCHSLEPYFTDLTNKIIEYDFYIVCGDFNVNLLRNDAATVNFYDLATMCGLNKANFDIPTRYAKDCEPSLLDIF